MSTIPAQADQTSVLTHPRGTSLDLSQIRHHDQKSKLTEHYASIPTRFSLKNQAPPTADQGTVSSGTAWATGYTGMGILLAQQKNDLGPMAPMFLYSQAVKQNSSEWLNPDQALDLLQTQGITTQEDWGRGLSENWRTLPTDAQRKNALNYRLAGYTDLLDYDNAKDAIRNAVSHAHPVLLGMKITASFDQVKDVYIPVGAPDAGQVVTVIGYDEEYITAQNHWGDWWGNKGLFRLPWSFVLSDNIVHAYSMDGLKPTDPVQQPRSQSSSTPDATGRMLHDQQPTDQRQPGSSSAQIRNGGFEDGTAYWSGDTAAIASTGGRGGNYSLVLGGAGRSMTRQLSQTVKVSSRAKLTFYLKVETSEVTSYAKYDKLAVNLLDKDGRLLSNVGNYSNLDKSDYKFRAVDLASYAGQTVRVQFVVSEDSIRKTAFSIDDISL